MIFRSKLFFTFCLFLFSFTSEVLSQRLEALKARWNDSFKEWDVYTDEGEGTLTLRWQVRSDWTAWDFRVGELSGTIDMRFPDNPEYWELRCGSEKVYVRTQWPRDITSWTIETDQGRLIWKSYWRDNLDEWLIDTKADPNPFNMYTEFIGDQRDWIINDQNDGSIPFPARLAMAFITVFQAMPKF